MALFAYNNICSFLVFLSQQEKINVAYLTMFTSATSLVVIGIIFSMKRKKRKLSTLETLEKFHKIYQEEIRYLLKQIDSSYSEEINSQYEKELKIFRKEQGKIRDRILEILDQADCSLCNNDKEEEGKSTHICKSCRYPIILKHYAEIDFKNQIAVQIGSRLSLPKKR